MLRSFAVRGVVEGFYGPPWSHDARARVMSFLAGRGMNAYAYAPKDDPRHRSEWRMPYGPPNLERFGELAAHASGLGIRFGFAISPGLDIDYGSSADRECILRKLAPIRDAGVSWFLLLLDDIPLQAGLASRQADLASWLYDTLAGSDLTVCPTEYVGTHPSPYLSDLGAGMPTDIDVMWTGPTVCSPRLTAGDARGWTAALGDRRVVVWDNYPVNDALMTDSLHLGPYTGRDPALADVVGGVLCNPMTQPFASQVALATAMDFLGDPDGYDSAKSWARAIDDVGGEHASGLAVLARACADSPLAPPDSLELAGDVEALAVALQGSDWVVPVSALRAELSRARSLADEFPVTDEAGGTLAAEIAPWAAAARPAAEAALAALRLVQSARPVATSVGAAEGRALAVDPEPAMHAAFLVLYLWKGARVSDKVVFGPRFALYTPVVQLADGSPALDAAAAVREDGNAIDALCRLALATYDAWRIECSGEPVRAVVDDEERVVDADGSFDARGSVIEIRQGSARTRFLPGTKLPFSDRRLA